MASVPSIPITVGSVAPSAFPGAQLLTEKPAPKKSETPLHFQYAPSPDGKNRNLLIFLHGLGDTEAPFYDLGRKLNLPRTAVLSIRAPIQIPLLEEPAFMFYNSFTFPDFMPEPNPNPSEILSQLSSFVTHLTNPIDKKGCNWSLSNIHFFGFGQGGSVACELALRLQGSSPSGSRLGSLVTIAGPLLSFSTRKPNQTPVLAVHRPSVLFKLSELNALKKAFGQVKEVKFKTGEGMPKGQAEWGVIMKFWSEVLGGEQSIGGGGEMYEVLQGGPSIPR
ncbi:Lysophospholipase [Phaffia rhodozyma]|uniref:Lysophospholipase n=1 Tax=Phaffia rhodozyma TaxID=264483 RepID=A0A0F7SER5_PHARH|nr:Lysophospholipase [Phaffia rhodozyma]